MNYFDALLLGLVQGLTEFIPVSSSGHLIIINEQLGLSSNFEFDLILNVGTLCAAIFYFRNDLYSLLVNKNWQLISVLVIASIPAATAGVLFKGAVSSEQVRSSGLVAAMLIILGILFMAEGRLKKGAITNTQQLDKKRGFLVGVAQAVALLPGTSRSGATILAGRYLGINRPTAARFSFLLSIPIIAGAVVYSLVTDPIEISTIGYANIIFGIAAAFVSSMAAIHFMLTFLKKAGLKIFGLYRVLLGLVLLFLL